jgi:tetratricopeptide (TPR) repeat protein
MKALSLILVLLAGNAFGNFTELMKQGDQYDVQSKPASALQYYLPAEKLDPANAALLVKIARQYVFRMNDMSSSADQLQSARTALSYAERAVKVAPNECDSHLAMAICLGKLTPLVGNKEAVEISRRIKKAAETAVKLDPQNDYAWHMLGRWHQALADVGGVTRLVAKVVYGELPAASNEEAVRCFEKAIALNPGRLIHFVELGRTYAQMGKKQEAKQLINKGLAMPNREKDDPETKQRGRKTLAGLS